MSSSTKVTRQEHWETVWNTGVTPGEYFDRKKPLPEFTDQIRALRLNGGKVAVVPGCGRGYDVELLTRCGLFDKVYGLEISETGARVANKYLSSEVTTPLPQKYEILIGDFFEDFKRLNGSIDFVYDYTFFCAIQLDMRPKWAQRMKAMIKTGGQLVTVMYPCIVKDDGPPFGVAKEHYENILMPEFKPIDGPRILSDEKVHERREGKTWWCTWERM